MLPIAQVAHRKMGINLSDLLLYGHFKAKVSLDYLNTLKPRPNAKLILVQPFQNRKTAETVARQTGAAVLDAAQQPGAIAGTATYIDMIDHLVGEMAAAFKAKS